MRKAVGAGKHSGGKRRLPFDTEPEPEAEPEDEVAAAVRAEADDAAAEELGAVWINTLEVTRAFMRKPWHMSAAFMLFSVA